MGDTIHGKTSLARENGMKMFTTFIEFGSQFPRYWLCFSRLTFSLQTYVELTGFSKHLYVVTLVKATLIELMKIVIRINEDS
jgi:hypothetical protein